MKAIPAHLLAKLQKRVKQIRNICILAHVDHGKTTLADTLVASNGIISQKMAGKLRYMDSLEEEQLRGITMKSSAISLYFTTDGEHYLINLIDSPGHIDFASEVSTAVRLCDGAIIVIDAVEGVSPQTHAVLRQAWLENIRPVLLFNKVDRLITELKLTSSESYTHLQQLLEQVNAVMAQLITGEILRKYAAKEEEVEDKQTEDKTFNWDSGVHADENDDEHLYFSPAAGNVIFGSALDGWGFGIGDFAEMYSKKLGLNKSVLMKTLWGDYFFNSKSKKVARGAQNAGKKTLFVQLILDNIWKVYKACMEEPRDMTQLDKLTTALSIKIPARELRGSDSQQVTKAIMSQWLPISTAMLGTVVEQTPSPVDMTEERVEALMCDHSVNFNSLHEQTRRLKHKFLECSSADEEPVIVYVSKMCPVEMKAFPEHQQSVPSQEDLEERKEIARRRHQQRMAERANQNASEQKPAADEQTDLADKEVIEEVDTVEEEDKKGEPSFRLVAFARIFSGKIRKGQKLYVLGPKHNPAEAIEQGLADRLGEDQSLTVDTLTADLHMTQVTVSDLYTFMGRELEAMEEVPAGNILGIGGLEEHVLKSATLSSDVACPSFSAMKSEAQPIVRVAVEPVHPGDMEKLVLGMRLLNQADSCVQVMVQETGEHVLVTAGEVHLQRCCDDLRKRYCGVAINVSEPIVPFRETIVEPPKLDMVNEAIEGENVVIKQIKDSGDKIITLTKGNMTISVEAVPLPTTVTSLLDSHDKLLQAFDHHLSQSMGGRLSKYDRQTSLNEQSREQLSLLRQKMEQLLSECAELKSLADKIWSFGPRKYGPNLLINGVEGYNRPSIWDMLDSTGDGSSVRDFDSSIVNGFQLATLTGPLCDEPMMGVAFVIRKWEMTSLPAFNPAVVELTEDDETGSETESIKSGSTSQLSGSKRSVQTFGAHSGQIISTVKEACRKAFQSQPQRLMCAMYSCVIQATASVLGKVYGVIGKRNGKVLSEDMQEGTQVFHIAAALPVAESFGFCDEIRKRTSGLASPQLAFSHWEVIDLDPYWEPCTEEEMAHFGEKYDSQNRAKTYMTQVRKRKGLKTEEKIVMHAEKQRTLGKKK